MTIADRITTERKSAGGSLLSKLRLAVLERDAKPWTIGHLAGFDLTASAYRSRMRGGIVPCLILERTSYAQEIEVGDDLTALGLVARLEHALDRFEEELVIEARRRDDAIARLRGYEPRLGEAFPLQGELDDKLERMAALEADLAKTESVIAGDDPGSRTAALAA